MSSHPPYWPTGPQNALPCNSTLIALVQSAVGLATNEISTQQAVAAGSCRWTGTDASIVKEAKHVWERANSFGYAPSTVWALCAVTIFGLSSLFHLYQLVKSRRWSYTVVLVGGGLQMAGWVERYYASQDITVGYVNQLALLTVAPTFFSAAIYSLFSMTAAAQDPRLLPLMNPRGYFITFTVVDFITLVIQAVGGALAATASDPLLFKTGCHTMLAGIVLQFVTTLAFLAVFGVYFRRLAREYPERHVTRLQSGTGVVFRGTLAMGALMIIRGCFRTAELAEGLWGKVSQTLLAVILLDCVPMVLVILLLNATHPLYTVNPLVGRSKPWFSWADGEAMRLGVMSRSDSAEKLRT